MSLASPASTSPRLLTAAKVAYGLAAVPVTCWCIFVAYGVARARYQGEATGPLVPFLLLALLVPVIWLAGLVGFRALSRRGKRWLPWAVGFFVPLLLWIAYFLAAFLPSLFNVGHATQMGG